MYLSSQSNLKLDTKTFSIIDEMSFRSKNLYNSAIYEIKRYYDETQKYLGYNRLDKILKSSDTNDSYRKLPAQVSQQTLMKLDKNYKSFFTLLKKGLTDAKTPRYLDKIKGRNVIIFTSQSFCVKDGFVYISVPKDLHKGRMKICKLPEYIGECAVKYIEIIPKVNYYSISIVYDYKEKETNKDIKNWSSIDLGIDNICTVTSNRMEAYIINGKPIKSINRYFNKKIAYLNKKNKTSNRIRSLFNKRGNKLNSELHKITSTIVDIALNNGIDTLVLGYNKGWKQSVNLGKKMNQKFVCIPYKKVLDQLAYKCQKFGINFFIQEESYTSKTSYFDNEPIKKQQTYKGKRIKRGLFLTGSGVRINSDVNGSLNIFRKFAENVVGDVLLSEPVDIGLVINPRRICLNTSISLLNAFH